VKCRLLGQISPRKYRGNFDVHRAMPLSMFHRRIRNVLGVQTPNQISTYRGGSMGHYTYIVRGWHSSSTATKQPTTLATDQQAARQAARHDPSPESERRQGVGSRIPAAGTGLRTDTRTRCAAELGSSDCSDQGHPHPARRGSVAVRTGPRRSRTHADRETDNPARRIREREADLQEGDGWRGQLEGG
jgi:hypothetical protein